MSHEIRMQLSGLLSLAEGLLESDLDTAQRRYAEAIGHSGKTLMQLVEDSGEPEPGPVMGAASAGPHAPASELPGPRELGELPVQIAYGQAPVDVPRILLAEDNEVDQLVAVTLLKRLGYRVDVVADGLEAVDQSDRARYSAILMECRMPRLDGCAATAEIRRRDEGQLRVPVIAMTSRMGNGEHQRCLASGMDDFVGKPLSRASLAAVLDRNLHRAGASQKPLERRMPSSAPLAETAFDPGPMSEIFAMDADLGAEVVKLFTDQARRETGALAAALGDHDAPIACQIAHRLKGASVMVGASGVARVCDRISKQGAERDFEHLPGEQAELVRVVALTESEITNAFTRPVR